MPVKVAAGRWVNNLKKGKTKVEVRLYGALSELGKVPFPDSRAHGLAHE